MAEIYKNCLYCGRQFRIKNNVQKYCSGECLNKATADYRKAYKRNYKPYKSSAIEKKAINKGSDIGFFRKCETCGKEFLWFPEWAYKRFVRQYTMYFCSWKCLREKTKAEEDAKREKLMKNYEY